MTELESRCLDVFPTWLRTLGEDARAISTVLGSEALSESARRQLVAALNYLFKSLDLIPDGIEDIGFIDDAFVFRVAAARATAAAPGDAGADATLSRLSAEAELVAEFLAEDSARLTTYVINLQKVVARGRTVDAIVADAAVREAFVGEVQAWAQSYQAPSFSRDEKNLVKLRSFLSAKLPA